MIVIPLSIAFAIAFRQLYIWFCDWLLNVPDPYRLILVSRYISTIHAILITTLSLLYLNGVINTETNIFQCLGSAIPIGYLIHDTQLIYWVPALNDKYMIFHHLCFIGLMYVAPVNFPIHTARGLLSELSVPFLNLGWIMIKSNLDKKYRYLFNCNAIIVLILFLIFRVYTFVSFTIESFQLGLWGIFPFVAGISVLNIHWFGILVKKIFKL